MASYYCEVCFAVPLNQSFTYLFQAAPEEELPQLGQRIQASFGRSIKEGWIISVATDPPQTLQKALAENKISVLKELEIIETKPLFSEAELHLARWLSHYYVCSLGEALSCILPTGKKEKEPLSVGASELNIYTQPVELSAEQKIAVELVNNQLTSAKKPFYYLFGPTGSGKTEVFLQCMEHVLQAGKSVIYLVPEISLSYQLQEQLEQRFTQSVALLHSHLSADQRLWYWRSLQQGECRIVLGARSAVFAPMVDLGLIILDEEHEQSYKAGDTPRYHARQVAMRRCRDQNALLLMGSATPSVEAMYSTGYLEESGSEPAKNSIELLRLSQRLAGGSFPKVEIIDLRRSKTVLSEHLVREIEAVTSDGKGQAILFLNRRGYSPIVQCFSCGKVQECRHCSIALTYHKSINRLKCHHCGFTMPMVSSCTYCHQRELEFIGFGTEQIEEELQRSFSHLRVARLDTDVARKKGHSKKVLQDFREGSVDLLVGTQMVAKGLNFAGVKLVGVVLADTSLNMPDFRAAERSFSLLVQVAGRAGRFSRDGRVLIQTYQPENSVVTSAAALDWQGFYRREIELRKMTHYPPFSRMIRLVFRGGDLRKVRAEAGHWYSDLKQALDSVEAEIFEPCECPYFQVSNKYRYHILLRSNLPHFGAMHRCIRAYYWQAKRTSSVYVEIDIDPSMMM